MVAATVAVAVAVVEVVAEAVTVAVVVAVAVVFAGSNPVVLNLSIMYPRGPIPGISCS